MKKLSTIAILLILIGCSSENQSEPDNSDQAMVPFQKVESMAPEQDEIYHFLLGEIAMDRDERGIALQEYEALNKSAPDALTAARATSIAIEEKDYASAAKSATIWADATPTDMQTQAITASIFLKINQIDKAMPFLVRLLSKDDQKTFENLLMLRSTLEDDQHAKAFIQLMNEYGGKHKDMRVLYVGATTAQDMKDLPTAIMLSNKIAAINPDWLRGAVLKVQLQYESGKINEALSSIEILIKKNPKEGMFQYLQVKMLLEKGDYEKSLKALNELKEDPKYRDEALLDLARISFQKKDFKTANELLNQYLVHVPNSDEANYFSGYVSQQLGNAQAALERFQVVKPGVYYVNARIQTALILSAQGQVDAGLKLLDPLSEKYPKESSRIDLVRTQLLLDANRVQEAYVSLNKILAAHSADNELRYIRGLIAMELGHLDVAESDFRQVLKADPKQLDALNDLSSVLLTLKKYQEAREYIERALRLAPDNRQALENLGQLPAQQKVVRDQGVSSN